MKLLRDMDRYPPRELCDKSLVTVRSIVIVYEVGIRRRFLTKVQRAAAVNHRHVCRSKAFIVSLIFRLTKTIVTEFSRIFHHNTPLGLDPPHVISKDDQKLSMHIRVFPNNIYI
jgi:hypothetical protein